MSDLTHISRRTHRDGHQYTYTMTLDARGDVRRIEAGCRTWRTLAEMRDHYGDNPSSRRVTQKWGNATIGIYRKRGEEQYADGQFKGACQNYRHYVDLLAQRDEARALIEWFAEQQAAFKAELRQKAKRAFQRRVRTAKRQSAKVLSLAKARAKRKASRRRKAA